MRAIVRFSPSRSRARIGLGQADLGKAPPLLVLLNGRPRVARNSRGRGALLLRFIRLFVAGLARGEWPGPQALSNLAVCAVGHPADGLAAALCSWRADHPSIDRAT